MKSKRFNPDQAITPKRAKEWKTVIGPRVIGAAPKFGEIYHVKQYLDQYKGVWTITLHEFGDMVAYSEEGFDPVVETDVLAKELETINMEVVA